MLRDNLNDLLGFLRGCRGAQLHPGGGEARRVAIGIEPYDPRLGERGSGFGC